MLLIEHINAQRNFGRIESPMNIYFTLMITAVLTGPAFTSCASSTGANTSNIKLEANDTIVTLGKFRILIPRSDLCEWYSIGLVDSTWVFGIEFHGCGETAYDVNIHTALYVFTNEHDRQRSEEFINAVKSMYDYFPSRKLLLEGQASGKRWELSTRTISELDSVYDLHVILDEKKYYLDLWYEIGETYYDAFEDSGEIDRIVKNVQVWPADE